MKALLLVALVGCLRTAPVSRVQVTEMPPVKVEIINEKPDCYFPDAAEEIDEPVWPEVSEDFYRRQYVHRAHYSLAIQHIKDQDMRISALVECVRALTTPKD